MSRKELNGENKKKNFEEILEKEDLVMAIYGGSWTLYYKSAKEGAIAFAKRLFCHGFEENEIKKRLDESGMREWISSDDSYKEEVIKESKKILATPTPPTLPTPPTPPNTPTLPTPNEGQNLKQLLIRKFLEKEKKPWQSIGQGIHDGVFYYGTYIELGNGKETDAIVTSNREIFLSKDLNDKGRDDIRETFGLHYRDSFFADVLDSQWSNDSILKWIDGYTVDLRKLYFKLKESNQKFMIYEDERIHTFIALDIMKTYFFRLFPANARTYFHAEKGSGKTNQLMLYRALAFNPIGSPNFSSSSVYRIIESTSGTILIDDFDQVPDEEKNKLIQHIRTGYKPQKAIRSDGSGGKGNSFRPRGYDAYSHLVFNNVFGLGNDEVTLDRCIEIRLLKHPNCKALTVDYQDEIFKPIRDSLYCMGLQFWKEIKNSYKEYRNESFSSRDEELFKGLFAIAKVIGDDVLKEIESFASDYIEQNKITDRSDDWEYHLLKQLWLKAKTLEEDEAVAVSVKEISLDIADEILNSESKDFNKKFWKLQSFVGSKLSAYVLFKKVKKHNRAYYEIHRSGLLQVLESRDMVKDIVLEEESGVGRVGGVGPGTPNGLYFEPDMHIVSSIRSVLEKKPAYTWSVNEVCDEMGCKSSKEKSEVQTTLERLVTSIDNNSGIGCSKNPDDTWTYHLTRITSGGIN